MRRERKRGIKRGTYRRLEDPLTLLDQRRRSQSLPPPPSLAIREPQLSMAFLESAQPQVASLDNVGLLRILQQTLPSPSPSPSPLPYVRAASAASQLPPSSSFEGLPTPSSSMSISASPFGGRLQGRFEENAAEARYHGFPLASVSSVSESLSRSLERQVSPIGSPVHTAWHAHPHPHPHSHPHSPSPSPSHSPSHPHSHSHSHSYQHPSPIPLSSPPLSVDPGQSLGPSYSRSYGVSGDDDRLLHTPTPMKMSKLLFEGNSSAGARANASSSISDSSLDALFELCSSELQLNSPHKVRRPSDAAPGV